MVLLTRAVDSHTGTMSCKRRQHSIETVFGLDKVTHFHIQHRTDRIYSFAFEWSEDSYVHKCHVLSLERVHTGGELASNPHRQTLHNPARSRQIPDQTVAPSPSRTPLDNPRRKMESLFRQKSVIESKFQSPIKWELATNVFEISTSRSYQSSENWPPMYP